MCARPRPSACPVPLALTDGTLTSRQLVQRYLDRIVFFDDADLDGEGQTLNSIRELNAQALTEADQLDAERAAGPIRGPLHGIPVLLKDNIGTEDMPTTAGSIALEGSIPRNDAVPDGSTPCRRRHHPR